jgi:hypothetical protein
MAVWNTNGCKVDVKAVGASGSAADIVGLAETVPNLVAEMVDVTEIGDSDRVFVPGIRSGTASLNLFYDAASHGTLESAWKAGTQLEFTFHFLQGSTSPAPRTWKSAGYITSMTKPLMVNDVIRLNLTIQFSGEVTIV